MCVCKRKRTKERENGRNVLEITRKTKSQTKSEDRYWGRCSCGEEKTRKKKRKKKHMDEKKKKKKTKEIKENNIRNKKSKLSNITTIFSQ